MILFLTNVHRRICACKAALQLLSLAIVFIPDPSGLTLLLLDRLLAGG
jgi:hypothetical protein